MLNTWSKDHTLTLLWVSQRCLPKWWLITSERKVLDFHYQMFPLKQGSLIISLQECTTIQPNQSKWFGLQSPCKQEASSQKARITSNGTLPYFKAYDIPCKHPNRKSRSSAASRVAESTSLSGRWGGRTQLGCNRWTFCSLPARCLLWKITSGLSRPKRSCASEKSRIPLPGVQNRVAFCLSPLYGALGGEVLHLRNQQMHDFSVQ